MVVEEAQDLSPMQWRMVGRRGRYASWTIVGDPLQSAWPDPAEALAAREAALRSVRTRRQFVLRTLTPPPTTPPPRAPPPPALPPDVPAAAGWGGFSCSTSPPPPGRGRPA